MNVTVSRISPVLMELSVEVPADFVKVEVDKAYANLAKKAHVRGFRPGKAPRQVLTHLFGPQVASDVANNIVQETLPKVLTEKKVTPVSQPAVEAGKVDAAAAFSYKARFEVQPEIEDVKFEGFELKRPSAVVTEKMVEEQLEQLRHRHASLKTPEPARPVQKGDVVTIDFKLAIDGKEVKEGGGEGVQLEIGAGQALPELDAGLVGKTQGEASKIEAKFPEGHPREDFRGKTGEFSVTVTDVKERVLANLDDEFAKDVGSFQTLVELRADIHTRLEKMLKDRSETSLAEQIVVKLNETNPCEVPPSLVEQQCHIMEQEVAMQARRLGQRFTKEQAAGLHDQIHKDAEKKVRAGLLMATIAKKHDFKVTDEDIERGLNELAEETGKNVNKLRAEYRDKAKRDILIGMILEDKILDFIEGKSKITDAPEEEPEAEAAGDDKKDKKEKKKK